MQEHQFNEQRLQHTIAKSVYVIMYLL